LIISKVDLFERLGNGGTEEYAAHALLSEQIATKVDFFECGAGENHDLEDGLGCLLFNATVGEGQDLEEGVDSQRG